MEKEVAQEIRDLLLECSGKLDTSAAIVRDRCSEQEFIEHRRVVGQLMGSIYLDLLRPIFRAFPDLEPASFRRAERT